MQQIILIIHVLAALAVIGLVLVQQGKGSDVGAAFGSGASNTVFGSQGSFSFLFKLTAGLAVVFFATSMILAHMVSTQLNRVRASSTPATTVKTLPSLPVSNALPKPANKPAKK